MQRASFVNGTRVLATVAKNWIENRAPPRQLLALQDWPAKSPATQIREFRTSRHPVPLPILPIPAGILECPRNILMM